MEKGARTFCAIAGVGMKCGHVAQLESNYPWLIIG